MGYLAEVCDRLCSARDASPAAALRALAHRILDEHRPALAVVSVGSENFALHDAQQGLESAAQELLDAADALDHVTEKINAYIGDVFPALTAPPIPTSPEDWQPAERSVSVPHPARRYSADGPGQGVDLALTREWSAAVASALPERTSPRTTGVCVLGDGSHVRITSCRDEDAAQAELLLLNSPHFPPPRVPDGGFAVADHVETKIAHRMRRLGITHAVVVLNNRVCGGIYSCTDAVRAILPLGYTLVVWQPGSDRPLELKGRAQP
ncbi:DddA-like double-stranded DNA deaminase toxin [Allokutzneria sp. NRRL B-24872]|uniref:DddA-like double-stranded DNA deaminase toxin n=1 Tax=Allokutzneria sp. NRRL B-24872 TaxID=1137961 RepID=UPI001AEFCBC3|nr:DddA-like double-stranded DNA deaminase toxin [Allokutzneria sp. NRRL B-24872]